MTERTTTTTATLPKSTSTIGIDLGDRKSHVCVLDAGGQVIEEGTVPTTAAGLRKRFERCEPTRIAIEAGGQSGWVNDLLRELGHDVIVANPRKLRMIFQNDSKRLSGFVCLACSTRSSLHVWRASTRSCCTRFSTANGLLAWTSRRYGRATSWCRRGQG